MHDITNEAIDKTQIIMIKWIIGLLKKYPQQDVLKELENELVRLEQLHEVSTK